MVIYLGSLVQLCCGEGGTLPTNITGMCVEHSVSEPHWVCPHSRHVFFPGLHCSGFQVALQGNCLRWALGCMHFPRLSRSGSGSQVLHKGTDSVGPMPCALPELPSSSGDQMLGECTISGDLCVLISSPVLAPRLPRCAVRARSRVCHVSPLGADLRLGPFWWVSTVQAPGRCGSQLGACPQFGGGCCLWGRDCPLPSGSGCRLPTPLPLAGSLLAFSHPLF